MQTPDSDRNIKLGVREVLSHTQYAEVAFNNVMVSGAHNTIVAFSSIHSFLTHCAMVSKLLWSDHLKTNKTNKNLAELLDVSEDSLIKNRDSRNVLEHYDRYLKEWMNMKGSSISILDNNLGPKNMIQVNNATLLRHYEPSSKTFTLLDKDLNLTELYDEVKKVKQKSIQWLNPMIHWDDLDDDEKQEFDEDRLLDELSDEYETEPGDTIERLENLGYELSDIGQE